MKRVLGYVATKANGKGCVSYKPVAVSIQEVSKGLGISESTARRSAHRLCEENLLTIERTQRADGGDAASKMALTPLGVEVLRLAEKQ